MQAIFTVTQYANCTLLQELVRMQQCATIAEMHSDGVLDELNGMFEQDMEQCGLVVDGNGDVVYTADMTYDRAQLVTGRVYANEALEMLDEDGDDASWTKLQGLLMQAIVQRNTFVEGTQ